MSTPSHPLASREATEATGVESRPLFDNESYEPPKPPSLLPLTPSLMLRPLPPPLPRMESPEDDDASAPSARVNLRNSDNDSNDYNYDSDNNAHNCNDNGDSHGEVAIDDLDNDVNDDEEGTDNNPFDHTANVAGASAATGSNIDPIHRRGRDDESRRRRREERRRRKERAAAEHVKELENDARRFFLLGFFALPLLWLVSILYFHKEHKDENASPIIKKCTLRLFYAMILFL